MTIVCIDIGNSHVAVCVYQQNAFIKHFRFDSKLALDSNELLARFNQYFQKNAIDLKQIELIAIASVVPDIDAKLKELINHWNIADFWLIPSQIRTNIKFNITNLHEMGADLVAGAVAAVDLFPDKNRIIIDCGTATTILAVDHHDQYQGVAILPGIGIQLKALTGNAAKLGKYVLEQPEGLLATTTQGAIAAGIIYSHVATINYFANQIFAGDPDTVTILTGGWANLLLDHLPYPHFPDLVFQGIIKTLELNEVI